MTSSAQIERQGARVDTKVIVLPDAASRRPVVDRYANHRAVNLIVRCAFYVFIFSLLFEWPDKRLPMEIPTLIGFVYIALTLLQSGVCYRQFPRELWFYVAYLCCYAILCAFVEHRYDAIKQLGLMVQIFFLMWSGYNLLRYERIAKTALLTLVISCLVISVMHLLRIGVTEWRDFYAGSRYTALGQDPNNMASNVTLGLAALMGGVIGSKRASWVKYISAPLALIMIGAIFDTGSRGALLAFGIGFITFAVRRIKLGAKVQILFIVLSVSAGLVIAILQTPSMASWLSRSIVTRDTHNIFLHDLTSTGLFVAIPLGAYVIICMLTAWRARHGPQGVLPLAIVFMILMIDMSGGQIASKLDWLLMAYALASASPLLAAKPRLAAAKPIAPPRIPRLRPKSGNAAVAQALVCPPSIRSVN